MDTNKLKGMRILLAEDNVTNQLVASQMLEQLGASVDVASDGAIALDQLTRAAYDILLIDIEMPRVSGLDVIRRVRAPDSAHAGAPVIALTAYAMQEHRDKIEAAGADGLIPKPIISIAQFGADILDIVENTHARRARGAEPAPEQEPGLIQIDEAIYDSLVRSIGEDAMEELLTKIEVDLENVRRQIQEAARRRESRAMRAATHVLVSVAGAVGGVRLQAQAERLNALAHGGEERIIASAADETIADIDDLLAFVRLKIGDSPEP